MLPGRRGRGQEQVAEAEPHHLDLEAGEPDIALGRRVGQLCPSFVVGDAAVGQRFASHDVEVEHVLVVLLGMLQVGDVQSHVFGLHGAHLQLVAAKVPLDDTRSARSRRERPVRWCRATRCRTVGPVLSASTPMRRTFWCGSVPLVVVTWER